MRVSELTEDLFGDLGRARKERLKASGIWITKVNKDGSENRMVTATKHFRTKDEAINHHNMIVTSNPGKTIAHNLHVENDLGKYMLKLTGKHEAKK